MSVVFKKKTRRNFRRKNLNEDNEEEGELGQAAEIKNAENPERKAAKSAPSTLLSFDHDDDEQPGEVFKVKKSKESRKFSKQRAKVKKTKDEKPEEKIASEGEDADQKLESLREELSNLGGDEEEEEEKEEEEEEGKSDQGEVKLEVKRTEFRTPLNDGIKSRSVGAVSKKGQSFHIPDAAAIHAARKSREKARQLGGDYIPVDDTIRYTGRFETAEKSRLIREDDNDHSDEEHDAPLGFGTRKSNTSSFQRRLEVEQALAKESDEEGNSEEEDDALRRFEEEQIRKGVSIPQAQQEDDLAYNLYVQHKLLQDNGVDLNYSQGSGSQFIDQSTPVAGFHQPSYPPFSLSTVTMDMIWEKMNNRIVSLQEVNRGRRLENDKMSSQLESCDTSITSLEKQMGDAERRFGFFQEMRGYVRDLIECLNEKVRQYNVIHWLPGAI